MRRAGLRQFVGDRQRGHHGEPLIADFAMRAAQLLDAVIDLLRELGHVIFLPILAAHPVMAAVDRDIHLGHRIVPLTRSVRASRSTAI